MLRSSPKGFSEASVTVRFLIFQFRTLSNLVNAMSKSSPETNGEMINCRELSWLEFHVCLPPRSPLRSRRDLTYFLKFSKSD